MFFSKTAISSLWRWLWTWFLMLSSYQGCNHHREKKQMVRWYTETSDEIHPRGHHSSILSHSSSSWDIVDWASLRAKQWKRVINIQTSLRAKEIRKKWRFKRSCFSRFELDASSVVGSLAAGCYDSYVVPSLLLAHVYSLDSFCQSALRPLEAQVYSLTPFVSRHC